MRQVSQGSGRRSGPVSMVRSRWRRMSGSVRRRLAHPGPDRDALLTIFKSVVAASAAWLVGHNALGASSATFAPFTALLMVQATISQSLDRSARFAAAMVVGVVLAGLVTPLFGAAAWTFAGLILVALILGRWRKLGQQVGVAALFAYSAFSQSGGSSTSYLQLASIAGWVARARSTVEHAAETMRFNPRRLFMRGSSSFEGHRTILTALERATEQLRSMARGLTYAARTDQPQERAHETFLAGLADVVTAASETARVVGELHSADDTDRLRELDEATDRARRAYSALAESVEGRNSTALSSGPFTAPCKPMPTAWSRSSSRPATRWTNFSASTKTSAAPRAPRSSPRLRGLKPTEGDRLPFARASCAQPPATRGIDEDPTAATEVALDRFARSSRAGGHQWRLGFGGQHGAEGHG